MVSHELGYDEEEVMKWPISRLRRWMTYFQVKADLEQEAFDKAKRQAELNKRRGL